MYLFERGKRSFHTSIATVLLKIPVIAYGELGLFTEEFCTSLTVISYSGTARFIYGNFLKRA